MPTDRRLRGKPCEEEGVGSRSAVEMLTERETDVLRLMADGRSNKEIARALYITPHTVKAHITRILHKLDAESRTKAAVMWTEERMRKT